VFFRATSVAHASHMFHAMGVYLGGGVASGVDAYTFYKVLGLCGVVLVAELAAHTQPHPLALPRWPAALRLPLTVSVLALIAIFGNFDDVPFIYFQF